MSKCSPLSWHHNTWILNSKFLVPKRANMPLGRNGKYTIVSPTSGVIFTFLFLRSKLLSLTWVPARFLSHSFNRVFIVFFFLGSSARHEKTVSGEDQPCLCCWMILVCLVGKGHPDVIAFIGSQLPLVGFLFPEANFPKCLCLQVCFLQPNCKGVSGKDPT